ncbi:MAG TPA: phospholipase D-like domain-containing protein [Steroidobacteraceae bacterium]|nr:phospholipase D-like domain-containing protein [Steroidobacteraceae bacterium]
MPAISLGLRHHALWRIAVCRPFGTWCANLSLIEGRRVIPWIVSASVLATLLVTMVVLNFRKPEKEPHHRVDRSYSIRDPQFKREMGVLLGPAIVGGNRIEALQNGDEIFPAMLAAIRAARRTITFETYIYWSGDIGAEFAQALIERAQAGVKVHLMLDWVGCDKISADLVSRMKRGGVEVERYHPVRWYTLGRLNNRTHRKVLTVDGMVSFTGGVGIADQWLGHAQDGAHWRDMHFKVSGPVVAQMQAAFLDNWIKTTGHVLHGDAYFPEIGSNGDLAMQMFISSPEGGSDSMRLMYLTAITAAERRIDIEAAYFVPDRLMIRELISARRRGVRIRLIVPGAHIDAQTVGLASKHEWGPLLESGVQIFIYQPTMLHCKMLIFDEYMVSVGSTNFDMRSFELNDEASLNVYDPQFASEMTHVFESDIQRSTPYTREQWRARPLRERWEEIVITPIRSQL